MDLTLYVVLIFISLVLIFLSFYASEHSELGLVGFLFLFLLSMVMIGGDLQYKTGENTTITTVYNYDNTTLINSTEYSTQLDNYETFTAGGVLSHTLGYYLAIASIVGFIGVLVGLRSQFNRRREEED